MSWISLERLEKKPEITGNEVEAALGFATGQVIRNLPRFTDRFQKAYSDNGFYEPTENVDWTPGFWTGEIWLTYEYAGDQALKRAGEVQMESFLKRIETRSDVATHDLGFMYSPSCVAGYKLTGSPVAVSYTHLAVLPGQERPGEHDSL